MIKSISYEEMSLEQLEQENIRLSNERSLIVEKQRVITQIIDQRLAEKSIADKINNMSNEELKAMYRQLTQTIQVNSAVNVGKGNNNG